MNRLHLLKLATIIGIQSILRPQTKNRQTSSMATVILVTLRFFVQNVRLAFSHGYDKKEKVENSIITYLDLDDKLGSDVFRRLLRWFRCDRRSLYDSERFTDTGADLDFVLHERKKCEQIK